MEVKHEDRKHSMLSASGSSKWLNCPASARLEEKFPNKTSVYAEEGTLAHELTELECRKKYGIISDKVYKKELAKKKKHPLYNTEMDAYVESFCNIVEESYKEAKTKTEDAEIRIETRVDFSHIVEKGFGTVDRMVIADGTLEVIDFKYGRGVEVSAENNSQLMLYAIGALKEASLLFDINKVKLTIVQPRISNYSQWEISVKDLEDWGLNYVKPKADLAYLGEGGQKPGDWCKFCKAKPVCRALYDLNLELAKKEFKDPQVLTDEEILEVNKSSSILIDWLESIKSYMLDQALDKNKKWKGFKLVESTTRRRWSDEKSAMAVLRKNKFKQSEYIDKKLKSFTVIEKLVGREKFREEFSEFIIKPQGRPILVDENDKRPALGIEQAIEDFSNN